MSEEGSGSGAGSGSGEVNLPSEEDLGELPRRAVIAFAGRCARRVQPLYKHLWLDAPQEHVYALNHTITLVENSAVSPVSTSDFRAATAADDAGIAADAADAYASAFAAFAASAAAAATVGSALHGADAADEASDAVRTYCTSASAEDASYDDVATVNADAAMRRDYELLKAAAESEEWTDETPVPSEFFGPLWPGGVPEGWPEEHSQEPIEPHVLKVQFAVPRGMSNEQSRQFNQTVKEFFVALSALDASMGGTGLQIIQDESEEEIEIEDEEPVRTGCDRVEVGA